MKRAIGGIVSIALLSPLTGCASSGPTFDAEVPSQPSMSKQADDSTSLTVSSPEARNLVETVVAEAALVTPYATIEEMATAPETAVVIQGEVISTEDFCLEGNAYRRVTIRPAATFKAKTSGNVTVVEYGGVVPTTCLSADLDGKFGEKFVPTPGEYVEYRLEGQEHTEVGDEVLAFLTGEPDAVLGGTNALVRGPQGLFVLDNNGVFVRSILDDPAFTAAGIEVSVPSGDASASLTKTVGRTG